MEKRIKVNLRDKIEPSQIAKFVQTANRFDSSLYIEMDDNRRVSAKSIMGMMNFLVADGEVVTLRAQGEDQAEALEAMCECLGGEEI